MIARATVSAHDEEGARQAFLASEIHTLKNVHPTCIFAAGRKRFEVHATGKAWRAVLDQVFDALPLYENGWRKEATYVIHLVDDLWEVRRA